MKRAWILICALLFSTIPQAQIAEPHRKIFVGGTPLYAITHVSDAASGGEVSTVVSSISTTTVNYAVSVGNLLVCFGRASGIATITLSDTAGNTFTATNSAVSNSSIGTNQLFYSVITAASSADVITQAMSPGSNYNTLVCRQFSKAGGSWHLDAAPAGVSNVGSSTATSNTFTTTQATELILFIYTSYGGNSPSPSTAPTIGGVGVSTTQYTNATVSDQWNFYLLASTVQTGITGTTTLASTDPWAAWVASFYAQ